MNRRILKLNNQIRRTLMDCFIKRTKPPLPGFVSVKEVSMALDMKSAKVFLSVMNFEDCRQEVLNLLDQERWHIQRLVSRSLKIKFCPRLNFFVNYVPLCLNSTEEKEQKKPLLAQELHTEV